MRAHPLIPLAALVALPAVAAAAPAMLRNDDFNPPAELGFDRTLRAEEHFGVLLDVPEEIGEYQVCAVYVMIGPGGQSIFEVRLGEGLPDGDEARLIWQTDLDPFLIAGSVNQLTEIYLRDHFIVDDARSCGS